MKKLFTLIYICIFAISSLSAQNRKEGRKKIKALKISYLTEQLNLTLKEAEKFWPIYNNYDQQKHFLRNEVRTRLKTQVKDYEKLDQLSEKDAEILVNFKLFNDKKIYDVDLAFLAEIKSIISYKKILKLQLAEREFGKKLMRKYRQKRKINN